MPISADWFRDSSDSCGGGSFWVKCFRRYNSGRESSQVNLGVPEELEARERRVWRAQMASQDLLESQATPDQKVKMARSENKENWVQWAQKVAKVRQETTAFQEYQAIRDRGVG